MNLSIGSHWHVAPRAELAWRRWGDEYVIHHFHSNDTHRLALLPGQIVEHLALHGESTAQALAEQFLLDDDDAVDLLNQLEKLDFLACRP